MFSHFDIELGRFLFFPIFQTYINDIFSEDDVTNEPTDEPTDLQTRRKPTRPLRRSSTVYQNDPLTIFQDLVKKTENSNKIGRYAQSAHSPLVSRTQPFTLRSETSDFDICPVEDIPTPIYNTSKSSPGPSRNLVTQTIPAVTSSSSQRKSPTPTRKKRLSDSHVIDMNVKRSPVMGLTNYSKSPVALQNRRGKNSLPTPDLFSYITPGVEPEVSAGNSRNSKSMSSFKKAKASLKGLKYIRGKSTEATADDYSDDDSEKSSTNRSRSGLNRQKSFTEATKKGLRRLSSAFKSGIDLEDEDEDQYIMPSDHTTADIPSGASAGEHPRSATVGMYVTPPTLERGAGGLHEILHAKKSLRKSESNRRW